MRQQSCCLNRKVRVAGLLEWCRSSWRYKRQSASRNGGKAEARSKLQPCVRSSGWNSAQPERSLEPIVQRQNGSGDRRSRMLHVEEHSLVIAKTSAHIISASGHATHACEKASQKATVCWKKQPPQQSTKPSAHQSIGSCVQRKVHAAETLDYDCTLPVNPIALVGAGDGLKLHSSLLRRLRVNQ